MPLAIKSIHLERMVALMVSVFGDDSADETGQRIFAVAGVLGTEDQWGALETAWLQRNGGIPFHATDCESDSGDYKNRDHADNLNLYRDLTQLLAASGVYGFGVAFDVAAHREFFPDVSQDLSYYNGIGKVITHLSMHAADMGEIVKFTFDMRPQTGIHNAGLMYGYMMQWPEIKDQLFPEISFACSEKQPRIQVGDLLAREAMKHLDNIVGPVRRATRKSMEALTATGRFKCDMYMRDYFEDKFKKAAQLEKAAEVTYGEFRQWLEKYKLIDNVSNRMRFLLWLERQDSTK